MFNKDNRNSWGVAGMQENGQKQETEKAAQVGCINEYLDTVTPDKIGELDATYSST